MQNNPDFLTTAYIAIKSAFWFVFGVPFDLWNSRPINCWAGTCWYPQPVYAAIAWVLLIVLLIRFAGHVFDFNWKSTAFITAPLLALYLSLPMIAEGVGVIYDRKLAVLREQTLREGAIERRQREIRYQEMQQQRRDYMNRQAQPGVDRDGRR